MTRYYWRFGGGNLLTKIIDTDTSPPPPHPRQLGSVYQSYLGNKERCLGANLFSPLLSHSGGEQCLAHLSCFMIGQLLTVMTGLMKFDSVHIYLHLFSKHQPIFICYNHRSAKIDSQNHHRHTYIQ